MLSRGGLAVACSGDFSTLRAKKSPVSRCRVLRSRFRRLGLVAVGRVLAVQPLFQRGSTASTFCAPFTAISPDRLSLPLHTRHLETAGHCNLHPSFPALPLPLSAAARVLAFSSPPALFWGSCYAPRVSPGSRVSNGNRCHSDGSPVAPVSFRQTLSSSPPHADTSKPRNKPKLIAWRRDKLFSRATPSRQK